MKKEYKVILVSMSGVRVFNQKLLEMGLTLPGFVDRSKVIASLPSLGLLTLAAHTPPNWQVVYKEIDTCEDSILQEIEAEAPDLVAFSSLTARINETYKLSSYFRQRGIKTAIGGLHVSALPEEAAAHTDFVLQGEGENIWQQLLADLEAGSNKKLYSSLLTQKFAFNLEQAKIPRYDLLDIEKYNRLTLQTTRGCPLSCNFCAASRTISAYKKKPIQQVEKELQEIFKLWPRPFIELADDNTFVDKKWAAALLALFARYKMKWFTECDISIAYDDALLEQLARSGCAQVLIGFETTYKAGLQGLDKANWKYKQWEQYQKSIEKIQSYGISVNGCFIFGFDTDNAATMAQTEAFIKESKLSEVQITLLTPFPGTALYHQLKSENRLLADTYWDKCTLFDLNFIPKQFEVAELEYRFQETMANIYARDTVQQRKSHFKTIIKNRNLN